MRKKRPGDIIILHMCAKNYDHMMYGSSDMVRNRWTDGQIDGQTDRQSDRQADRQTDRQTDKVTYRGG